MNNLTTPAIAVLLFAGTAVGQVVNWTNPAGGLWNLPANWSTGTVPSLSTETANFNIGGTYTATLNLNTPNLGSLTILDPMCSLNINPGIALGVDHGIANDGQITINPINSGVATSVTINSTDTITGSGTLTLAGNATRAQLLSAPGISISHGLNHTINGFGRITADMGNDGTVSASTNAQTLELQSSTWSNSGTINVINAATMAMNSMTISNFPTSEIAVENGQLNLTNTSIADGTLRAAPGMNWATTGGTNTFSFLTTEGTGRINAGTNLHVINSIDNNGDITINPTNAGVQTTIEFQNPSTITGSGEIVLNGSSTRALLRANLPENTITQSASHTIRGFGSIQGTVVNNGTIEADAPAQTLLLNTNNQINNNLYRISNSSTMNINAITIDQSGGGNIDIDDGLLSLSNTTLLKGSITAGTGSAILAAGTSTFDQIQLDSDLDVNAGTILAVSNGLDNNDTLTINPINAGVATILNFTDSSSLSGTGQTVLNGSLSRAQLTAAPGQTITLASPQLLRGFGQINATLINNSTIDADAPGQTLTFQSNDKVNNNTISAQLGATLSISGITIDQSAGGSIDINEGSLLLANTQIIEGSINATTGTATQTSGTSTLHQVQLDAPLSINAGTIINITNGITNNNTIAVNPTNAGVATSLNFTNSATLAGTGRVVLTGSSSRAQLTNNPKTTLTISPTHTVQGFGQIHADLLNNGHIDADSAAQTLLLLSNNKANNALISIQPGATIDINGIELTQSLGGQILNNDGLLLLNNATINGGTLDALFNGSTTVSAPSTFDSLTTLAPTNINPGTSLSVVGTITNHNTITINPTNAGVATTFNSDLPATILGSGDLVLNGSSVRSQITGAGMTIGQDQTIRGIGQINAPLSLDGTIAPGFSIGEIEASAPITLSNTSLYQLEVSGTGTSDLIDSSSSFHADGTLELSMIDGFDPEVSWAVSVVTADTGVTGTFDNIIAPPPPADPRLTFKVGYFDNEIRVGAVCDADLDFSASLNFLDVSFFLNAFSEQNPVADFTGEGSFNFLDVSAFLASFGTGCP